MCFPQREEALKQHKTLSQELVNLRGELGKSFFFFGGGGGAAEFYGAREKLEHLEFWSASRLELQMAVVTACCLVSLQALNYPHFF